MKKIIWKIVLQKLQNSIFDLGGAIGFGLVFGGDVQICVKVAYTKKDD